VSVRGKCPDAGVVDRVATTSATAGRRVGRGSVDVDQDLSSPLARPSSGIYFHENER